MNKLKEFREWTNWIVTIIGAIAIVYLNLRFENLHQAITIETDHKFITGETFRSYTDANDARLNKMEDNIDGLKLDHVRLGISSQNRNKQTSQN